MNLIESLQGEIKRNEELLEGYDSIPQGKIGAIFIRRGIEIANKTINEVDTVGMVKILKSLRENN